MTLPSLPVVEQVTPTALRAVLKLDEKIDAMMAASAMDATHARRMQLRLAGPSELDKMGRKSTIKTVVIPYFDLDGSPISFCRYRYLEDARTSWEKLVTQTKSPRYFQAAGTTVHAYFPPFADWEALAADATKPLIVTEGEKKAACATTHGFPTIGLGGVDSFVLKGESIPMLPELMRFRWEGRPVTIIYDSDASENPNVLAASIRLGRKLMAQGAKVCIASLDAMKDGHKQGLDDFIVAVKKDKKSVQGVMDALLATANTDLFERELALYDFNRQFVYIRDMDRIIVREDQALLQPDAFIRRAYAAAKHREWKIVTAKDGSSVRVAEIKATADEWMKWDQRLTAKILDFDPLEGEFTDQGYNIWRGWAVEEKAGPVKKWIGLLDKLFANTNAEARKWFEQWCAYPIQNPGAKLKSACLLWSHAEGTGKSTILESLRAVYGPLYAPMNDSAVDLQWTDWLVNKLIVGVDDIAAKNRDDHAAKWKNLITAPRLTIQKRHTHSFEVRSCVNFIMTSNEPNALRLSNGDRRYFIHEAAEWGTIAERETFFDAYYDWLNSTAGTAALLHHLKNLDLTGFNPDAPALNTASKELMKDMGKGPLETWLINVMDAPDAMLKLGGAAIKGDLFTSDDLAAIYNNRTDTKMPVSRVTMGMALTAAGAKKACKGQQVRLPNKLRVRLFALRNGDRWANSTGEACIDHYIHSTMGGR